MLTREDDIDVHALRRQGWTITAIARHLGRDRKTIRAYLAGDREAGVRARSTPGPFEVFAPYCAQRLADDPHLLVGALSHSGCWRGLLCESEDQPHLIDGLDRITRALGGLTRDWRFDRMATVITPGHREGQRLVRGRRQVLRRRGSTLSAAAWQPQGRRGEGQPRGRPTVLADPARRRVRRGGPSPAGY